MLMYRIVKSSKPELEGMFRHRERAARIGWWFDNLLSLAAGQFGKEYFFPGCAAIVAILVARQVNTAMNGDLLRRCTAPH